MTHFFVQASDPGASILSYGKEIVWIEMMTIVITDLYDDQTRHFLSSLIINAFIFILIQRWTVSLLSYQFLN